MFGLGPLELGIILVIVVVLFGARRLPELGASIGKTMKNFQAAVSGDDEIDVTPEKKQKPEISEGGSTSGELDEQRDRTPEKGGNGE